MSAWAAWSASTTSAVIRLASTTGNPSSSALTLTGEGSSFLPRPRTASGRVTTSAISFPAATSEVNEGTAKSGVPINTIRIKVSLLSTKAEIATNNGGKPSTQPIRNNNSTRTNIPKTKERAAIKAALPTKQLSAKMPLPGPRHPGETSSVNVVPGAPAYIVPRAVSQRSENV